MPARQSSDLTANRHIDLANGKNGFLLTRESHSPEELMPLRGIELGPLTPVWTVVGAADQSNLSGNSRFHRHPQLRKWSTPETMRIVHDRSKNSIDFLIDGLEKKSVGLDSRRSSA